jgi:hypothetical protein
MLICPAQPGDRQRHGPPTSVGRLCRLNTALQGPAVVFYPHSPALGWPKSTGHIRCQCSLAGRPSPYYRDAA